MEVYKVEFCPVLASYMTSVSQQSEVSHIVTGDRLQAGRQHREATKQFFIFAKITNVTVG